MALPSSGPISFNDVRTEMSQSNFQGYVFSGWAIGYGCTYYDCPNYFFSPINVNSGNSGKYSTTTPISLSNYYGYNHSLSYTESITSQSLPLDWNPGFFCYPQAMLVFDMGTNNHTSRIKLSSSSPGNIEKIAVWYGKPWAVNGEDQPSYWNATLIYSAAYGETPGWTTGGLATEFDYSYTYNSGKGQYIYVVITGNCP